MALLCAATAVTAQPARDKPRVPPGVDPGGVAIAIIGSGIDYTHPEVAKRLARDGEGEIVGWDFVDNDRRPFYRCGPSGCPPCISLVSSLDGERSLARLAHRLIFLRVTAERPQSLVEAVQASDRMGARIVVVAVDMPGDSAFLLEAARRHPQMIFVADIQDGAALDALPREPDNLFVRDAKARGTGSRIGERVGELMGLNGSKDVADVRKSAALRYWAQQDRGQSGGKSETFADSASPAEAGCPSS